jgi:hypothetical protein
MEAVWAGDKRWIGVKQQVDAGAVTMDLRGLDECCMIDVIVLEFIDCCFVVWK